ncbi:MAG: MFS transporter, partial [bacterium]
MSVSGPVTVFQAITKRWPAGRVLAHRDFRLMWMGAFLSFFGSQLQNVAEGDYVWQMTHDQALLARVGVMAMLPGTFLFPVIGFLIDIFNKRSVMTSCMVALGLGSAFLGFAIQFHFAAYYQFVIVALVAGLFGTVEMPTRQSIVRECVPPEDISSAIPLQAMTFNLARVLGPACASIIIVKLGSALCFFLNALSFIALIWAPYMIKADLKPVPRKKEPFKDLIFEGVLYTFRHPSLRKFFILEAATSILAIFYVNQLPAYVDTVLHLPREFLGYARGAVGVGAIGGLLFLGGVSDKEF